MKPSKVPILTIAVCALLVFSTALGFQYKKNRNGARNYAPVVTSSAYSQEQMLLPSGWRVFSFSSTTIPVDVSLPNGWTATSALAGVESMPEINITNPFHNTSTYIGVARDESNSKWDHTIGDLLRDTDLFHVSTTTIGGLPAVQGYPFVSYAKGDLSMKTFSVFSPNGMLYSIEYDCASSLRLLCDQIVSYIHFK